MTFLSPYKQFSIQMDLIRQQLEFEVQQLRSVMEERFGTSDEMVQRTQVNRILKYISFLASEASERGKMFCCVWHISLQNISWTPR